MILLALFAVLAFDLAGYAHGDLSPNATAIVALVVAIVAVVLALRDRSAV